MTLAVASRHLLTKQCVEIYRRTAALDIQPVLRVAGYPLFHVKAERESTQCFELRTPDFN